MVARVHLSTEAAVAASLVPTLLHFLAYIRQRMHVAVPHCLVRLFARTWAHVRQVLWYDSVVSPSGELRWQNELNSLNKPFYDACDGILLNYLCNPQKAMSSVKVLTTKLLHSAPRSLTS
jgi:mannosyl-glycoprotein endo-beta-N-acetylglucosaminidase